VIGRRLLIGLIGLACMAWAGCYASTEPATEVQQSSAKLHAHGTANNGEATSYFELWPTGLPSLQVSTGQGFHWPAGASGPFSRTVEGLYPSTPYSFRVCGRDDSGGNAVCAQTLAFTTTAATKDEVWGGWFAGPSFNGTIRTKAGPSGESPNGYASSSSFTGFVTCLIADGNRAIVGAVNQEGSMIMTVIDGGPSGSDSASVAMSPLRAPPPCGLARFGGETPIDPDEGELIVIDAP
jgi:hypothetical protein